MRDDEKAIQGLRAATRMAPDDAGVHRLLAQRLAAAGMADEAHEHFRAAVALDPADDESRLGLARLLIDAGDSAAALAVLEDLMAAAPTEEALALRARAISGAWNVAPVQLESAGKRDRRGPPDAFEIGSDGYPEGVLAHRDVTLAKERAHGPVGLEGLAPPEPPEALERPRITFADVGGMHALKEEIRLKIIYPASHPDIYRAYGQTAGGGVLLFGPPGCGKTHLARATAGEIGASFMSVGIADVLDMWIGSSERNLHGLFEVARTHAPAVMFFDEVDALAADRADFRSTAGRAVINQFLAELDGMEARNDGLLVIAATNAPWHLDPAFLRPGRFGQAVFVPPPDPAARAEILSVLCRNKPASEADLNRIAHATNGYSGADLKAVIDRAAQRLLVESLRDGVIRSITTNDLLAATAEITPTTTEWFLDVRNYVRYQNQTGFYDAVRPYLK